MKIRDFIRRLHDFHAPVVILVTTSIFAFVMTVVVQQNVELSEAERLNKISEAVRTKISRTTENYLNGLMQTRGLFEAYREVRKDQFRRFVGSFDVRKVFPGMQGLGYSAKVDASEKGAFIRAARRDDPEFKMWPANAGREHHTVLYIEPLDERNKRAVGFDMYSDAVRRQAMIRARDTGLPAATSKVTLVQETGVENQAGFLVYIPVYKSGTFRSTIEQRRKNLQGFVYGAFRTGDLFRSVLESLPEARENALGIEVYDGERKPANLLFRNLDKAHFEEVSDARRRLIKIEVAGEPWTIALSEGAAFHGSLSRLLPVFTLAGGLLLSLLLYGMTSSVRKQAEVEKALAEQEKRARVQIGESAAILDTLLRAAPTGLGFVDKSFRFVHINDVLAKMFGVDVGLGSGRLVLDVVPDLAPRIEQHLKKVIDTGEPLLECEIHGKTFATGQQNHDWLFSYYPVKDSEGRHIGIGVLVNDYTERKLAQNNQRQLVEATARLSSFVDYQQTLNAAAQSPLPVQGDWATLDLLEDNFVRRVAIAKINESGVVEVEAKDERFAVDPLSQRGISLVMRSGEPQIYPSLTPELLPCLALHNLQMSHLSSLGLKSAIVVPLLSHGKVVGTLTAARVNENERYTEQSLEFFEELARRASISIENASLFRNAEGANRAKDEFLATLSHELRTPLNAIVGWADLLEEEKSNPEVFAQGVEALKRNAKAQEELINDLLDVSRIISGKLVLDLRSTDISSLVKSAVEAVRFTAHEKSITLECDLPASELYVQCDARRVQQIVWNLLTNALKFTPANGRVFIEARQEGETIRIRVADTGQGIEPQFLPHVFDRFRQQDGSITRRYGGLGLGLAIARHISELHGGRISVSSEGKGKGATFEVELPAYAIASHTEPPLYVAKEDHLPARPITAVPRLNDLKVLVVDDAPDVRVLVSTALSRVGAKVETVESGKAALKRLQEKEFDILISDIGMPDMDGYELMTRARTLQPFVTRQISSIALSAYVREEERNRALDAGFDLHVAKPVNLSDLVTKVSRLAKLNATV